MLDRLLRDACPHDPAGWHATVQDGEPFTICPQCGYGWFTHDSEDWS